MALTTEIVTREHTPVTPGSSSDAGKWPVAVLKIAALQGHTPLRALASVQIGPLVIHECRLLQPANQPPFVSMPRLQDAAGNWRAVVTTQDEELRTAVKEAVLEAWRMWLIFRVGPGGAQ